eukprot:m.96214 g.96214  ORF g.96214 m.96214 type:complete len:73 (-) comp18472_c0_seq3:90-308(-)
MATEGKEQTSHKEEHGHLPTLTTESMAVKEEKRKARTRRRTRNLFFATSTLLALAGCCSLVRLLCLYENPDG